jgi:hypothetical protein
MGRRYKLSHDVSSGQTAVSRSLHESAQRVEETDGSRGAQRPVTFGRRERIVLHYGQDDAPGRSQPRWVYGRAPTQDRLFGSNRQPPNVVDFGARWWELHAWGRPLAIATLCRTPRQRGLNCEKRISIRPKGRVAGLTKRTVNDEPHAEI